MIAPNPTPKPLCAKRIILELLALTDSLNTRMGELAEKSKAMDTDKELLEKIELCSKADGYRECLEKLLEMLEGFRE